MYNIPSCRSLNAALVDRAKMLDYILHDPTKNRPWKFGTLANFGESKYNDQAGFEVGLLNEDWGKLHVPMCLSVNGIFRHHEIDS